MAHAQGKFNVMLDGRGKLTLRDADYLAKGGEGTVYKANATVVKIYTDKAKMRRDGMVDKVWKLAAFKHESIVAPQGLVLDESGREEIGFYMPFVEGEAMMKLFITDFRTKYGITEASTVTMVERMRDTTCYAHAHDALTVDANEANWLVDLKHKGGPLPLVIDVDSWIIGKGATSVAIMPSIQDPQVTVGARYSPTRESDWFSWGVVTFQLFTGIHPYKGRLDPYRLGDWQKRMVDQASVFAPGIKLPGVVRDFSCIPAGLRDWYEQVFQHGLRVAPPAVFGKVMPARASVVLTSNGKLVFERLFGRTNDPVVRTWPCGAALLASGELVDMSSGLRIGRIASPDAEVVKAGNGWLLGDMPGGVPTFTYVEGRNTLPIAQVPMMRRMFRAGNRLFAVTDTDLMELSLLKMAKPSLTVDKRWSINPTSSKWFEDVMIADVLGATFLYYPLADGGMVQKRVPELDGLTPVVAKAGHRFVTVVAADRKGDYHKLEFTFDKAYTGYTVWQGGVDSPDLNATLLPKGVMATVVDDGELTLFVPTNTPAVPTKVQDRGITTAMQLAHWDDKVIYLKDGNVWRVKLA